MVALFASTLLLSALLLFCVEPMIAKMLLPLLGGVPAVWNTCMVFFQAALLGGYAVAMGTLRALGPRRQPLLHLMLLAAALLVLPITVAPSLATRFVSHGPLVQVLCILGATAGLPFFALSTMAPTLQRWFSTTGAKGARDPYFLYAASNLGSLAALVAYPFVVEPLLGLRAQSLAIRAGYALLVTLTVACAVATWRAAPPPPQAALEDLSAPPVANRRRLRWVFLTAVPSAYLVAMTEHITTDVAPTPLLWTLPLAVYLLSFVLVFARKPPLSHARVVRIYPLGAAAVVYTLLVSANDPAPFVVGLHLVAFFGAAMVCHGELARDRPGPARLTEFYVWMSVGGLVGGLAVALVAPAILDRPVEYPLAVVLALMARPMTDPKERAKGAAARRLDYVWPAGAFAITLACAAAAGHLPHRAAVAIPLLPLLLVYGSLVRPRRFALSVGAILAASGFFPSPYGDVLLRRRNFFGELLVARARDGQWMRLTHGTTIHGVQSLDPRGRHEPRSYYTRSGPIGDVFRLYDLHPASPHVAIIGLGAGTLAAYARPADDWTFYEINPAVVQVAEDPRYFTYLSDAFPGGRGMRIVLGDARLEIARAEGDYGLLVVDAFSSDAIPVHLVTVEAMRLYATKMAPGGLIAWHISNRHVNLLPVLAELAAGAGWQVMARHDTDVSSADVDAAKAASLWAVMARDEASVAALRTGAHWEQVPREAGFRPWTDDRSAVVSALVF